MRCRTTPGPGAAYYSCWPDARRRTPPRSRAAGRASPRRRVRPRRRPAPVPRSCGSGWWRPGWSTCGTSVSCPTGRVLVTERGGRLSLLSSTAPGATVSPVRADLSDVWARGEGGLMGLVVHPDFVQSRPVHHLSDARRERVRDRRPAHHLAAVRRSVPSATRVRDPLVGGLPINPSGRHSGCRPTIAADGALLVGTGDTARGSISQDLTSLGGKVLRIDLATGGPPPDNPFVTPTTRRSGWSGTTATATFRAWPCSRAPDGCTRAEHGPSTDDEVNLTRRGSTTAGIRPRAAPSAATTSRCR